MTNREQKELVFGLTEKYPLSSLSSELQKLVCRKVTKNQFGTFVSHLLDDELDAICKWIMLYL